jgi:hypothetical protein
MSHDTIVITVVTVTVYGLLLFVQLYGYRNAGKD